MGRQIAVVAVAVVLMAVGCTRETTLQSIDASKRIHETIRDTTQESDTKSLSVRGAALGRALQMRYGEPINPLDITSDHAIEATTTMMAQEDAKVMGWISAAQVKMASWGVVGMVLSGIVGFFKIKKNRRTAKATIKGGSDFISNLDTSTSVIRKVLEDENASVIEKIEAIKAEFLNRQKEAQAAYTGTREIVDGLREEIGQANAKRNGKG